MLFSQWVWVVSMQYSIEYLSACTVCGLFGALNQKTNERIIQYDFQLFQAVAKRQQKHQWSHTFFLPALFPLCVALEMTVFFVLFFFLLRFAIHELADQQTNLLRCQWYILFFSTPAICSMWAQVFELIATKSKQSQIAIAITILKLLNR